MRHPSRSLAVVGVLLALTFTSCLLVGPDGQAQHLVLRLVLQQGVANGGKHLVHVAAYPDGLAIKGYFVRISGRIVPAEGSALAAAGKSTMPRTVKATATAEADSERDYRFNLRTRIQADGTFAATKKYKRDIPAGATQTFRVQPQGGELGVGDVVILCVDVAPKKADLPAAGHCVSSDGPPSDDGLVATVEVLDNEFSPRRLQIQAGQTVRWVLMGSNQSHTTTAMSGAWDSGFVFNAEGDFFERTFPSSEDGQTFEYSCVTHSEGGMRGSVLVGEEAPDPGDGY